MIKLALFTPPTKKPTISHPMSEQTDPQTLNINIWPTVGTDIYHVLGNAIILTNGTCLVDAKIWLNKRRVDDCLPPEVASVLRQKTYKHVEQKTSREIELFKTDF